MTRAIARIVCSLSVIASVLVGCVPEVRADGCQDGVCTSFLSGYTRGRYDAVAWAEPSAKAPRGTLALGYAHRAGVRLVEWDVAGGRELSGVSLGGRRGGEADVAVTRTASGAAAVVADIDAAADVRLTLVSHELRITSSRRLGTGSQPAVASRGEELFVAWLATADSLTVLRLEAKTGIERERTEIKLPAPAAMFPKVSLVTATGRVLVAVRTDTSLVVCSVASSPGVFRATQLFAEDAAVLSQDGIPHVLVLERDATVTDSELDEDLVLRDTRIVDHDASSEVTGAFGPDQVLALPSGLLVPDAASGRDPAKRATRHRPVERVIWVGAHVVMLETGLKKPSLAVTWTE